MKVHFSSLRNNWKTPKRFYEELDKEFNFDFDPCPVNPNFDGLTIEWGKRNFCNPPYSKIKDWIIKAWEEKEKGKLVVLLIPSRTDTRWWHDFIMKAEEIRFIKGRLKFDEYKNSAPFPSAVVILGKTKGNKQMNKFLEKEIEKIIMSDKIWAVGSKKVIVKQLLSLISQQREELLDEIISKIRARERINRDGANDPDRDVRWHYIGEADEDLGIIELLQTLKQRLGKNENP